MLLPKILFLVTFATFLKIGFCELNPYRHVFTLDKNYRLEYLVDWDSSRVIFNVTVNTRGYVGFGLSRKGKMSGADIVIGGVGQDGNPYFTDRHAIQNQLPEIDESQDYRLDEAWERNNQTFLSFSRPFDTCDDDHDLPITSDLLNVIWAYGEVDDEIQYHFQHRGSFSTYILDPDISPRDNNGQVIRQDENNPGGLNVFNITGKLEQVPLQETTYFCNYHKTPTTTRQHIVGFNPILPTSLDAKHIHHLILYRCRSPPGVDPEALFEEHVQSGGQECYTNAKPDSLPAKYCSEILFAWAVGGRAIFFPEHVGLPMTENGTEYFLLETHYDNPTLLPNLNVSITLEAYYTDQIRPNDIGVIWIGQIYPGSPTIVLPPNSLNHITMGHCAPECTEKAFPEPVHIFATLLHTHISGSGVRALHFRGQTELPWINSDDNYNFNFQQFRILREERTVLPGDHLTMRCEFDTTPRNGSAVVGGFSTRQEMCNTLLYYFNRIPGVYNCLSEIRSEEYVSLLGVANATWDRTQNDMVVRYPPEFAGMPMGKYTNDHIEWDIQMRNELQKQHLFGPQVSMCPNGRPVGGIETPDGSERNTEGTDTAEAFEFITRLPSGIRRYTRPRQCSREENGV